MKQLTLLLSTMVFLFTGCADAQTSSSNVGGVQGIVSDLDATSFAERINEGGVLLIDVRTPGEYADGHLKGAVNMDWTAAGSEEQFSQISYEGPILLYCAAGGRSGQAKDFLTAKGLEVAHLQDGYNGWTSAGLAVEK